MLRSIEGGQDTLRQVSRRHDQAMVEQNPVSIDKLVIEIKNIKDSKEKLVVKIKDMGDSKEKSGGEEEEKRLLKQEERLLERLLLSIHPRLMAEVGGFFAKYEKMLSRRGIEVDDIYSEAVQVMIRFVDKWQTKDVREAAGEDGANFLTFFFHKEIGLGSNLVKIFIRPALTAMRLGNEISMDHPRIGKDGEWEDPKDVIVDSTEENNVVYRAEVGEFTGENLLNRIYLETEPFLSLFLILNYGLGKDTLRLWKERFDISIRNNTLDRHSKKYISEVDAAISEYDGSELTTKEIGARFGMSGANVRLKIEKARGILRK